MYVFTRDLVGDDEFPGSNRVMEKFVGSLCVESQIHDMTDQEVYDFDDGEQIEGDPYFILPSSVDREGWAWSRRWLKKLKER